MKYFIIMMLFISTSVSAMTFNQAKSVYNRMIMANGFTNPPQLVLSSDNSVNASYGYGRIIVNKGLLRAVINQHEMALVLGHELHHWRASKGFLSFRHENDADSGGAWYAYKAGYSVCKGKQIFKRVDLGTDEYHIPPKDRYQRLLRC